MNTFLSSSLSKEYYQMNFLQNIIIGSRFINECKKYWVPYYMPTTVLGVVENSRLKKGRVSVLEACRIGEEIHNNFLKRQIILTSVVEEWTTLYG